MSQFSVSGLAICVTAINNVLFFELPCSDNNYLHGMIVYIWDTLH